MQYINLYRFLNRSDPKQVFLFDGRIRDRFFLTAGSGNRFLLTAGSGTGFFYCRIRNRLFLMVGSGTNFFSRGSDPDPGYLSRIRYPDLIIILTESCKPIWRTRNIYLNHEEPHCEQHETV